VSAYAVEIQDKFGAPAFPAQRVIETVCRVLSTHTVEAGTALTIVLTGDELVRRLNAQFRGVNVPTDILSFPADPLPAEIEDEPPYLGDLIIACPYTSRQAEEAGHALDDEFVLLAVHGTLHLLGYDHDSADHQDAMWAEQSRALADAGITLDVPRFTFGDEYGS
jgi:probable rRNA maturation factor